MVSLFYYTNKNFVKLVSFLAILILVGTIVVPGISLAQDEQNQTPADEQNQSAVDDGWAATIGNAVSGAVGSAVSSAAGAALDLGSAAIQKILSGLLYIVSVILGAVIAIEAWFITVVLTLNMTIVDTKLVQLGFDTSLQIVNLGFVLGLIIIAIATILRWEGYGMKRTLRNFVIAALLVNFSLVIAGSFIRLSDGITLYFLQSGFPSTAGGLDSIDNFATAIVRAYAPQKYFNPQVQPESGLGGAPGAVAQGESSAIAALVAFNFTVLGLLLTVVVLAAFIIMLFYRYVMLSGLLIVMPFVWLMWIFPSTQKYWGQWWGRFLNQVFFAPIAIAAIWLVVAVGTNINTTPEASSIPFLAQSTGSGIMASMVAWAGGTFVTVVETFMMGLILNFLMIGGLKFASSMGAGGASVGMKWAESAKNAYVGYVGSRSRRMANYALNRNVPGTETSVSGAVRKAQNLGASSGLVGRALSYVPRKLAGAADHAITSNQGVIVEEAAKSTAHLSTDEKIRRFSSGTTPEQIAWFKDILKEGRQNEIKQEVLSNFLDESRESIFKRYDQGKVFKDGRNESGITLAQLVKELMSSEKSLREVPGDDHRQQMVLDKEEEIVRHISALKNPEKVLRSYMQMFDVDYEADKATTQQEKDRLARKLENLKKKGEEPKKPINGVNKEELNEIRNTILKTMTMYAPPRVASKVFQEMAVSDEYDLLGRVSNTLFKVDVEKMKAGLIKPEKAYHENNFGEAFKKMMDSTPMRAAGIDLKMLKALPDDEREAREKEKKEEKVEKPEGKDTKSYSERNQNESYEERRKRLGL